MPRIVSTLEFVPGAKDRIWQMMTRVYEQLARVINGGISFGRAPIVGLPDGVTKPPDPQFSDNIDCVWIGVFFGAANTDITITHNLSRQLSAYVVARKSAPVDVYDSPTMSAVPPGQTRTWVELYGNRSWILRATGTAEVVLLLF